MVFASQSHQSMKGPNILGLYIPKDQNIETSESRNYRSHCFGLPVCNAINSKLRFQAQARSTQELDSDRLIWQACQLRSLGVFQPKSPESSLTTQSHSVNLCRALPQIGSDESEHCRTEPTLNFDPYLLLSFL